MKKKIGIILDKLEVSKQIHDFIQESKESKHFEITTIILQKKYKNNKNDIAELFKKIKIKGLKKTIDDGFFKIISNLESNIVSRFNDYKNFFQKYDISDHRFNVIEISPIISRTGLVYTYSYEDIKKIKSENLELLVRGGSGILKGEILKCCPNGIISFHHGDNDVNRGGPPGFWEVYKRSPKTGFIIQRLKEELDGGDVLFKGFIPTTWMYMLNRAKLFEISNPFLFKVIEQITSGRDQLKKWTKKPYSQKLFINPTVAESLVYIFRTLRNVLAKIIRRITFRSNRWGVAYQYITDWRDATLWKSKMIPNPANRYLADPFIMYRNGKHYCFVEDFSYKNRTGSISVYEIDQGNYKELGKVLEEKFHLSFPFIFEFNNEIYMCPETHKSKDIRIYKCIDFPMKWNLEKILFSEVDAADTTIFYKNEKWWLMTNMSSSKLGEHMSELHIFYSDNPLSTNWKPHTLNPVIFDPEYARNGGLIIEDDKIFRVHQRQGFDSYGKGLGISEIKFINEDQYEESKIFDVEPNFYKKINGTHTYNYDNGMIVFDYVKESSYKKKQ